MTAPTSDTSSTAPAKYRAGQIVTYRFEDPILGGDVTGTGVVLEVPSDEGAAVTVAPLADFHLQLLPERLQATRAADVQTSIARPVDTTEGS